MAGLLAAIVILLIAFGSVVAAGLPVLTRAVRARRLGVADRHRRRGRRRARVGARPSPRSSGIGVGIDYALLILTRFRSVARRAAATPHDAVVEAVSTAGRSVLVAGSIVMVVAARAVRVGVSYMNGVAIAAGLSVLVVMAASLTLLPARARLREHRVDRLRIPGSDAAARARRRARAARWSRAVQRAPVDGGDRSPRAAARADAAGAGLAARVPRRRQRPRRARRRGRPTTSSPRASARARTAPCSRSATPRRPGRRRASCARCPAWRAVGEPRLNPDGDTAFTAIVPATSPQDAATEDWWRRLRAETDRPTVGRRRPRR